MAPEGSVPCSEEPAAGSNPKKQNIHPRHCGTFRLLVDYATEMKREGIIQSLDLTLTSFHCKLSAVLRIYLSQIFGIRNAVNAFGFQLSRELIS
jgi:hypothetical protein